MVETKKHNLEQADEIRALLNETGFYEGRYYIEMLLQKLENSKKPLKRINPVADELLNLTINIKLLRVISASTDLSETDKRQQYENTLAQIDKSYKALVKASGKDGIFYKSRKLVVGLGGFIIAVVLATIGVIVGFFMGLGQDLMHGRKPTGAVPGAIAGTLIGVLLGFRMPSPLFISRETRGIHLYVESIGQTFGTLKDSLEKDHLEEYKQQILEELFNNDVEAFKTYLESDQQFTIATFPAPALTAKHKGIAGNHALMQISIFAPDPENPGQRIEHKKLIELGRPSTEKDFKGYKGKNGINQTEVRIATGEQVIKMLACDEMLQKRYRYHDGKKLNVENLKNLLNLFAPGIDDCHTYCDRILAVIGQPPNTLKRSTNQDFILGRIIAGAIGFFSPVPEKFKKGEPVNTKQIKGPEDTEGADAELESAVPEVEPIAGAEEETEETLSTNRGPGS